MYGSSCGCSVKLPSFSLSLFLEMCNLDLFFCNVVYVAQFALVILSTCWRYLLVCLLTICSYLFRRPTIFPASVHGIQI